MLTTGELAGRPDFALGAATVSPSTRQIRGPAGAAQIEPRVLQVLTVLADAAGEVVTRETLFDRCWGSAQVGDDSLNRAVAAARKLDEVAPGSFRIETIPRTGYRLVLAEAEPAEDASATPAGPMVERRVMLAGGVAVVGAASAGWWLLRSNEDRDFRSLVARGEERLAYNPNGDAAEDLGRAVQLRPDDARVRGLFAYALASRGITGGAAASNLSQAIPAAQAALALDRNQPDARLAQVLIRQPTLGFAESEDALRAILKDAPDNVRVMRRLWDMLQCVGRSREALALAERAVRIQPLGASNHFPRAQLLWITGRTAEADRVIERALISWPDHPFVRFARFTILAFTGRPRAALAMIEDPRTAPQQYDPQQRALWRISLIALDQRSPSTVAAAVKANVDAATRHLGSTGQAVMSLSALGQVDPAFELLNGLFVVPRTAPQSHSREDKASVESTAWRFAPWLFIPPLESMRADPRFALMCDAIGLSDYWRARKIVPDYRLAGR